MKKSLILSAVGALIITAAVGIVEAQKASTSNNTKNVIYVAPDSATFKPSPTGGVSMATLWVTPTRALMERTLNSSRGTTPECTRIQTMSGSLVSKALIYIKMKRAKSV
jgi:hypothetical protein